jgi:uncharacterized membrane protein YhaH (DUF805 family)
MSPVAAIRSCLAKYAVFNGRASRPEFWWFQLFCGVVLIAAEVVVSPAVPFSDYHALGLIAILLTALPALAVAVRRLHDTGRTGWWLLIGIVPLLGDLVLTVLCCLPGTGGDNAYGPDPGSAGDDFTQDDWERLEQRKRG